MNKFWKFKNQSDGNAELLLYGDIADSSWWEDEVTPKQFAEDLANLGYVTDITVRINSGGGDVFAAQAIGNQLEQHSANVTAKIDGLCASAATIIACHCNRVVAANDSTYMIHPVKMGIIGYKDATELQQYLNAMAAIRDSILGLYAKKTGRSKDEVAELMDATSWWTGEQAKSEGFVDELIDDGETNVIENRNGLLFINSVSMNMPFKEAPKFVQDGLAAGIARGFVNKSGKPKNDKEDEMVDIKTVDALEKAYPELVNQIKKEAAENAAAEERQRIQDIEDMEMPGSEDIANEAKFTKPISASDYAKAAIKRVKAQGIQHMKDAFEDAKNSGMGEVKQTPVDQGGNDEFLAAIKAVRKNTAE